MHYLSTRGRSDDPRPGFSDILLEGLAPDGGLYLPESLPDLSGDLPRLAAQSGLIVHEFLTRLNPRIPRLAGSTVESAGGVGLAAENGARATGEPVRAGAIAG